MKISIAVLFLIILAVVLTTVGCDRIVVDPAPTHPPSRITAPPLAVPASQPADAVTIAPDGSIHIPPGTPVELVDRFIVDHIGGRVTRQDTAAAQGTTTHTLGQKIEASQQNGPPVVGIGAIDAGGIGGGASTGDAGSSRTDFKLIGASPQQTGLYLLGGLLVAGGVMCLMNGLRGAGVACISGGFTIITCGVLVDRYPWVFLVAAGVGAAVGIYLLVSKLQLHRSDTAKTTALQSVVRAGEDLTTANPDAGSLFKQLVDYHTDHGNDAVVKKVVGAIKEQLNLKRPAPIFTPATPPISAAPVTPAPGVAPGIAPGVATA